MELTLDQALQKGIEAHKAGKVQEADAYYTSILKANPKHPDANHNMGVLAVGVGKVEEALPFLKTALEVNPNITQFWLSYINALIKLDQMDQAKAALEKARQAGAQGKSLDQIEQILNASTSESSVSKDPSKEQVQHLINLHTDGQHREAKSQALQLLGHYPKSINLYNIIGAAYQGLGEPDKAIEAYNKALAIKPNYAELYYNVGIALKEQGKLEEAIEAYKKAISLMPEYAEAHNNMGLALKEQGKLEKAIEAYNKVLTIKPDHAGTCYNIGNALKDQGKLEEAIEAYNKALAIKPDYAEAYWNLSGTAESIGEAKKYLEKCLKVSPNHLKAKLTLSALKFYEGDKSEFNELIKSDLRDHSSIRSFNWVFNLPKIPTLHFHRWALFDHMTALSKRDRPFYEFGVWRGEAFRYLINTFKKGYGFDTFEGLPEDWHHEKAGTYSSDGNIPKINGGKFIVGKFEDTLPGFFAEERPMASIVNFDADLYSSTICALNFCKPIIDQHTILIFDEFIINKNWEEDEYKALEEFCADNQYTYEVLAVSFFTKQVAVKVIGV